MNQESYKLWHIIYLQAFYWAPELELLDKLIRMCNIIMFLTVEGRLCYMGTCTRLFLKIHVLLDFRMKSELRLEFQIILLT